MRRHVAIHEGAITSPSRGVTGRGVMETGNDIPELPDPVGPGLDVPASRVNLVLPPLDHCVAARYHEGIVQPIFIILSVNDRAFLGKDKGPRGALDAGQFAHGDVR